MNESLTNNNSLFSTKEKSNQDLFARVAELQKSLFDSQTYLYIHGTNPESVDKILKNGLRYKHPDITSTAINVTSNTLSPDTIKKIMDWPHKGYKHLIMVGIPFEARVYMGNPQARPIWQTINKGDVFNDGQVADRVCYLIPPEMIIGCLDVNNDTIVWNENCIKNFFDKSKLTQIDNGMNPIGYNGEYIPDFDTK